MKTGTAKVNGTSLYYETMGKGFPLVFVSGGGIMDCRCWGEQFEFFAENHQVIRYDVRGIGRSARPNAPFSHSRDLYELLKFMQVDRTHLAGLSVGGAMAIDFTIEHPEMVDHLILAASGLSDDAKGEASLQALRTLSAAARSEGLDRLIQSVLDTPFVVSKENFVAREKIGQIYLDNRDVFESGFPIYLQWQPIHPPASGRLTDIRAKTLVIRGDCDNPAYIALSDKIAAAINGAKQIVIAGGTHFLNLEKPKQFNESIAEFLMSSK